MKFDSLKNDLLSLADSGLKYGKKNADQIEIYVNSTHQMTIGNQSGMIDAKDGLNEGVCVRVLIGKKLGYAATSGLTEESVKTTVKEAISVAKSVDEENKDFESFAVKQPHANEGTIDPKIIDFSAEDAVKKANELYLEQKNFDKKIVSSIAQIQALYGGYAVVNSQGLSGSTRFTAYIAVVNCTAAEGAKRKTAFDFSVTRSIIDVPDIGKKNAEQAIGLLKSKPLNYTGVLPTVWNQNIMANFWQTSLIQSVNGRSVVEKNSYFMDKLGDKVGSEKLSIIDDGQLPEGVNTSEIDHEGIARQKTPIVTNGVLKSFLYDNFYGRLAKTKSTGNAARAQAYESTPGIAPTTIVITPGTKKFDKLISSIDKGVLVIDNVMGLGHSNLISGDFSVVANSTYLIEKGAISHPLDSITIAGNLYKSYKDIIELGADEKLLPAVKTPSVVFDGFTVNG